MPSSLVHLIVSLLAVVFLITAIGSPLARARLRRAYPQLFEPVDPADIVFHRTSVQLTVVNPPRIPFKSRETSVEVIVTRTELIIRPEGPAFLFFPNRFLLLRVPLDEVEMAGTAENLSQASVRLPTMDRKAHMELWLLMRQYREFADAVTTAQRNHHTLAEAADARDDAGTREIGGTG